MSRSDGGGNYVKIKSMKAVLPQPVHESYKRHRKQRTLQIILPVALAVVLWIALIVLISVATFSRNGDVARWAAVSTMWLASHVFVLQFVFLALLAGMVYLLGRLLGIAPVYTGKAQEVVQKLMIRIRLLADKLVKPVIFLDSVGASLNRLLGRK
jgi:hypothetical protein